MPRKRSCTLALLAAAIVCLAITTLCPLSSRAFADQAGVSQESSQEQTTEGGLQDGTGQAVVPPGDAATSADTPTTRDGTAVQQDETESEGAVDAGRSAPASVEAPTRAPSVSGDVWVNGAAGSDGNAGTQDAPVQTFEKARELLEASGGEHIYVSGALLLSGADTSETWDLGGKSLVRDSAYHGELVSLDNGARLVLANIVLDGASGDGATGRVTDGWGGGGSLVGVRSRATLTIGAGALLQNNAIESMGSWYPESGGGVFAKDATVNMEGGTIRNNDAVWGGGIYGVLNATVNMSGGTIAGNHA